MNIPDLLELLIDQDDAPKVVKNAAAGKTILVQSRRLDHWQPLGGTRLGLSCFGDARVPYRVASRRDLHRSEDLSSRESS